jgi:hypothetical protein
VIADDSDGGELLELSTEECWQLVEARSVGRFAANRHGVGPLVVPVNYTVDDRRTVVFRTGPGAKLASLSDGAVVVIQVDEIDPLHRTGWSVIIEGTTSSLYEEPDQTDVEPWAPGPRHYVVRVVPLQISGRRIHLLRADTDQRGYR